MGSLLFGSSKYLKLENMGTIQSWGYSMPAIAAWIYPTNVGVENIIFSCYPNNGQAGEGGFGIDANANLFFFSRGQVGTNNIWLWTLTDVDAVVNEWQHVCHTQMGNFFYNGVAFSHGFVASTRASSDSAIFTIGGSEGTTFNGMIADPRVYSPGSTVPGIDLFGQRGCNVEMTTGQILRYLLNEKLPGEAASGSNSILNQWDNIHKGTPYGNPTYDVDPLTFGRRPYAFAR